LSRKLNVDHPTCENKITEFAIMLEMYNICYLCSNLYLLSVLP